MNQNFATTATPTFSTVSAYSRLQSLVRAVKFHGSGSSTRLCYITTLEPLSSLISGMGGHIEADTIPAALNRGSGMLEHHERSLPITKAPSHIILTWLRRLYSRKFASVEKTVALLKSIFVLVAFSLIGFGILKLFFLGLCTFALNHEPLEQMAGAFVPIVFGLAIGIEGFLWWREIR